MANPETGIHSSQTLGRPGHQDNATPLALTVLPGRLGKLDAVSHQLTYINPFTASNRQFVSVPYLLSDYDGATYNVLTHELTPAGPVSVSVHRVRSSSAHGFGDKINSHLAQAFDEIEGEVSEMIASGRI